MRCLFFLLLSLWSGLATGQLATLSPDAPIADFELQLEEYMTASRNTRAKDAYANFTGVFYGGGLDTVQQRRVLTSAIGLANLKLLADKGMANYLDLHSQLAGTEEEKTKLFAEFHTMLEQALAAPEVSAAAINKALLTAESYLRTARLDQREGVHGWKVAGGKPHFVYDAAPILRIDTVQQLLASTTGDSIIIQETKLIVDLGTGKVTGKGGRTDWQRVGLPSDIFVRLVDYHFDVDRQLITSDSAQFQYPAYFGDRILYGSFKDRLQSGGPRPAGDIPEFVSTNGRVLVDQVGEGMSLEGQFELRAARVYVLNGEGRKAVVTLNINDARDERKVRGLGDQFVVQPGSRITGQKIDMTVFFGQDSLYHPSISVDVNVPERSVELNRSKSSAAAAPFYHSGNHFNIDATNITVYLAQDSAVVGRRTASFQEKGDVVFESEDYFSTQEYARIKALAGFHPLEVIYRYRTALYPPSDTIGIEGLAQNFRADLTGRDIESVIYDLQDRGFLTYEPETGKIAVKHKLNHFVLSQRQAKDYDNLRIVSSTPAENAFIDLQKGTIRVMAAQPIQLNRKKKIAIRPSNEIINIVGDRNLDFGGTVYAGNTIVTADSFHLKYAPYYITFDSADIDVFLPEGGKVDKDVQLLSTASRIEDVRGYILLDAPKNKSGAEDIGYFPSIQTRGPSYVYYDQGDTSSLYSRDSFYFELANLSINNLDSLTENNLALEGELVSGGIFGRIKQTLRVQEDGSLGFVGDTDSTGQAAYGDRGTYSGQLSLTNEGLSGSGKLNYLEAEIESSEITFGVDSTTTTTETFRLKRSVTAQREVPTVVGERVNVTFRPYGDSLIVSPVEGFPFQLFEENDHVFRGTLVLTPTALQGTGTLDWSKASISSEALSFGADQVMADTSTVRIKSVQDTANIALRTTNVNSTIDFATGKATFSNNGNELATELPYIEFLTSANEFEWDLKEGNIVFSTQDGKDRFTSSNVDQDSLTFTAQTAVYDNLASQLEVGGVPFVISADAKIIPGDGQLVVQPGGRVAQLTNAQIVADTLSEYHVINRATVDIAGRKEYTASGFYEYNVGPHTQEFELQNIVGTRIGKGSRSEKATATRAEGEIAEETTFYIDDKTRFFGTISLDAGSPVLGFDGYARIESDNLPSAEWFAVQSEGDKTNLVLNTEGAVGRDAKPLHTGFYLSKPERQIYPSLVQSLQRRVDHPILNASGVFMYDEDNDAFRFGDSTRVQDPSATAGNLMVYDQTSGKVTGDGLLGIGGRLKYISMKSYGTIAMELPEQFAPPEIEVAEVEDADEVADDDDTTAESTEGETLTDNMFLLEEETEPAPTADTEDAQADAAELARLQAINRYPPTEVEAMTAIDLILPTRLTQIMATDIVSGGYSAPQLAINTKIPFATSGLEALFPAGPQREAAIAGLQADAVDLPPSINQHTFLFTDVAMRWNSDYQSWVSTQVSNGLASVAGQAVSRRIQSYLEVKMTTGGEDRLYLYIKSPSETYYFFGFKDGILNVVSNNNTFMNTLREMKAKELVLEMDDGQTYEILEVTPGTAATFLRRVEEAFQ
ncbi:hypothetical protein LEM8419_01475 [Neolewinella maritima]|uniref:Uncharacterized protein n=1 Tax=Neolewinella maritima TaxID=1383882 RepID=A0ABN8F5V1_9BACT|nr:hypothetical protein [Neolewinella maritima]CAH1000322.1 hypothetical protein LEM8419_01475 [Neolewinella maritima]